MIVAVVTLVRRVVAIPVLLVLAVIAQVSLVNRLPLPGNAAPNLVLLMVAAVGVAGGPVPGMLAGFLGGLALDVAPPGSDLTGEYALVFCLAGYLCGAGARKQRQNVAQGAPDLGRLAALPVMAAGAVGAEALVAGFGRLVSDPRMTVPAIAHVLPAAILYDILLCPFFLWLVVALKGAPEPGTAAAAPAVLATPKAPVTGYAVVRSAGVGGLVMSSGRATAVPNLRFAGKRPPPARPPARREPKLRLASGSSPSRYQTNPALGPNRAFSGTRGTVRAGAFSSGASGGTAFRNGAHGGAALQDAGARGSRVFGSGGPRGGAFNSSPGGTAFRNSGAAFRGTGLRTGILGGGAPRIDFSGALGPSLFDRPGRLGLGGSGLGALTPNARRLGRNWIRAGSTSAFRKAMVGQEGIGGRLAPFRSAKGPLRRGWLRASPDSAPSRSTDSASRSAGSLRKGWLRPAKPAPAVQRRTPGKGWLRPAKPAPAVRRRAPGKGWLRPAKPVAPALRRTPSRGWLSRKPARIMWQRKPRRSGWLRRKGTRFGGGGLGAPRTRIGGRR